MVQTDYPFVFLFCFYGDFINPIDSIYSWVVHGGQWYRAMTTGEFAFGQDTGIVNHNNGSRLVEATIIYCFFCYLAII